MKILILSFYFPPDLSPGSFRTGALVSILKQLYGSNVEVTVITSTPNRYKTYVPQHMEDGESCGFDRLVRLPIAPHKSGLVDQALAYRAFFLGALRATAGKQFDVVYGTTSRLMTGFTSAIISRRTGAPLVLDIRDLFVDTMEHLLAGNPIRFSLPLFRFIERFTLRSASLLSVVSEAFVPYLKHRGVCAPIEFFPNGIDSLFEDMAQDGHQEPPGRKRRRRLLYIGNIGDGQGLDRILPDAALRVEHEWVFEIVGYGGAIQKLRKRIEDMGITNIQLKDPVPRSMVPSLYRNADALFLHLNAIPAFERVIPSKLFEYGVTGKPIIAGITGYPASFISSNLSDIKVFPPCDVDAFIDILSSPLSPPNSKDIASFLSRFRRGKIMQQLAERILEVAKNNIDK